MSTFITSLDYNASIHTEILDSLVRSDETVVELAEDIAIDEVKGYLAERYDVDSIFSETGEDRNKLVIMMCIDIVLYHLHSAHNPMRFPEIRKERYTRAIEWLKGVRAGDITTNGLPVKTNPDETTGSQRTIFRSNPKRITGF
jgi:phage gp36-like protein